LSFPWEQDDELIVVIFPFKGSQEKVKHRLEGGRGREV
jgi:hypothetical protein